MMQSLLFCTAHAKPFALGSVNSSIAGANTGNKTLYSNDSQNSFKTLLSNPDFDKVTKKSAQNSFNMLLSNPVTSQKTTTEEKNNTSAARKDNVNSNNVQKNVPDRHKRADTHDKKPDSDSMRTRKDNKGVQTSKNTHVEKNVKISKQKMHKINAHAPTVVQKKHTNADRMDTKFTKEMPDIEDDEQAITPVYAQYDAQSISISMNKIDNIKDTQGISSEQRNHISAKKASGLLKNTEITPRTTNMHDGIHATESDRPNPTSLRHEYKERPVDQDNNATFKREDVPKELFADKLIIQKNQEGSKKRNARATAVVSRSSQKTTPVASSSVVSEVNLSLNKVGVIPIFGIHTNGNATDVSDGTWTQNITHQLQQTGNQDIVQQARLILQNNNNGEIRIQLNPKEFGDVKLIFHLEDNLVNAKAIVSSEIVKNAMQKNFDSLAQQFSQEGYDIGDFSVSVDSNSSEHQDKEDNRAFKPNTGIDLMRTEIAQHVVYNYVKVSDTVDFVA